MNSRFTIELLPAHWIFRSRYSPIRQSGEPQICRRVFSLRGYETVKKARCYVINGRELLNFALPLMKAIAADLKIRHSCQNFTRCERNLFKPSMLHVPKVPYGLFSDKVLPMTG